MFRDATRSYCTCWRLTSGGEAFSADFALGLFTGSALGASGSHQCLLTILICVAAVSDGAVLGTTATGVSCVAVGKGSTFNTVNLSDLHDACPALRTAQHQWSRPLV